MPRTYIPVRRKCKTGPKTILGKRRSSQNSLKHGLYAKKPHNIRRIQQLADQEYDRMRQGFRRRSRFHLKIMRGLADATARAAFLDGWLDRWSVRAKECGSDELDRLHWQLKAGMHLSMITNRIESYFLRSWVDLSSGRRRYEGPRGKGPPMGDGYGVGLFKLA